MADNEKTPSPPFNPKQQEWIYAQIDAVLAKEKGYLERAASTTTRIVFGLASFLFVGTLGVSIINYVRTATYWNSAESLKKEFGDKHERYLDGMKELAKTAKDEAIEKLVAVANKQSEIDRKVSELEANIKVQKSKLESEYNNILLEATTKGKLVLEELERTKEFQIKAKESYNEIVALLSATRLYEAIEKLENSESRLLEEFANRTVNDPDFFQLVAKNISENSIQIYTRKGKCNDEELMLIQIMEKLQSGSDKEVLTLVCLSTINYNDSKTAKIKD